MTDWGRTREQRVEIPPMARQAVGESFMLYFGNWIKVGTTHYTETGGIYSVDQCIDQTHKGPPYLSGGPLSVRHYVNEKIGMGAKFTPSMTVFDSTGKNKYVGRFWLSSSNPPGHAYSEFITLPSASDYSAQSWSRLRPDRPIAGLAMFIGEAKDIPRMLKSTAKAFSNAYSAFCKRRKIRKWDKQVAGQWVNANFGWLPFVSDLRNFLEVTQKFDDRYQRYRRNAGHWYKRKVKVSEGVEDTIEGENTSQLLPSLTSSYYDGPPYGHTVWGSRVSREVWAEGMVKYYLPAVPESELKARFLARLTGFELSPSLIYNLTPWSWLLDWFSNMGDIFENVSSSNYIHNNLVTRYAYSMCTAENLGYVSQTSNFTTGPVSVSCTVGDVLKTRIAASPFGFSLGWDDFSARQFSILAALGITRSY